MKVRVRYFASLREAVGSSSGIAGMAGMARGAIAGAIGAAGASTGGGRSAEAFSTRCCGNTGHA